MSDNVFGFSAEYFAQQVYHALLEQGWSRDEIELKGQNIVVSDQTRVAEFHTYVDTYYSDWRNER